jgi:hypothetical protein
MRCSQLNTWFQLALFWSTSLRSPSSSFGSGATDFTRRLLASPAPGHVPPRCPRADRSGCSRFSEAVGTPRRGARLAAWRTQRPVLRCSSRMEIAFMRIRQMPSESYAWQ